MAIVARRADRLAEVLERCQSHQPASRMYVCDLSDVEAAAALALQTWEEMGGVDVLVNNAAAPKRKSVQELRLDEITSTMQTNFVVAGSHDARPAPEVARPRLGHGRQRHELRRAGRHPWRGGLLHRRSSPSPAGPSRCTSTCGGRASTCASSSRARSPRRTGPARQRLAALRRRSEPAENVAAGIIEAIEGDRFEHYLPDMKPIVEMKTSDADAFFAATIDFANAQRSKG